MTELTWGQILNPELNNALNKVMRQSLDYHTALKILSLSKELSAEQKKAQDMRSILQGKFYDKTQDPSGDQTLTVKPGKDAELAETQLAFANTTFKVKSAFLKGDDLARTHISALELMALEPLIEA